MAGAELTLQHMHDEPDLSALPMADRYVLAHVAIHLAPITEVVQQVEYDISRLRIAHVCTAVAIPALIRMLS